ncbi:uncharacterized protein FOMMEDRAFT_165635 [Fomitiporia mediterranea MF3/22]|uniref:uncharacterized protein n=1 Tax=Fomitiporia mediterranea (strain MF3/22) TaxID=694068 RepID=UPI0004408D32|nr:uncharacterized protein FOMMEDRAFT_165635 [Fomitiporia mediterranea MF3/22]EJD06992.1 hypothetical protein FOMMEDRAFT_165635 [Fomitiporia mediterranea MF3/22]
MDGCLKAPLFHLATMRGPPDIHGQSTTVNWPCFCIPNCCARSLSRRRELFAIVPGSSATRNLFEELPFRLSVVLQFSRYQARYNAITSIYFCLPQRAGKGRTSHAHCDRRGSASRLKIPPISVQGGHSIAFTGAAVAAMAAANAKSVTMDRRSVDCMFACSRQLQDRNSSSSCLVFKVAAEHSETSGGFKERNTYCILEGRRPRRNCFLMTIWHTYLKNVSAFRMTMCYTSLTHIRTGRPQAREFRYRGQMHPGLRFMYSTASASRLAVWIGVSVSVGHVHSVIVCTGGSGAIAAFAKATTARMERTEDSAKRISNRLKEKFADTSGLPNYNVGFILPPLFSSLQWRSNFGGFTLRTIHY